MPIKPHACYVAACDVCDEPLKDAEEEGILHFDTEAEALAAAREYRWPVAAGGRLICTGQDDDHTAAIDELLPPEPTLVPDGQLDLDEGGEQ